MSLIQEAELMKTVTGNYDLVCNNFSRSMLYFNENQQNSKKEHHIIHIKILDRSVSNYGIQMNFGVLNDNII